MDDDKRNRQKRSFPLLVVETNEDHQLVIQYSLLHSMPQAEAVYTSTAEETLRYLRIASITRLNFPRVVLLDLFMPAPETGFQLLAEIRQTYPRLPIIVLSGSQEEDLIRQAYELGASSYLSKPTSLDAWERCFLVFNLYWSGTVTLPPK
ncbi:response regulator [Spirosoma koreense]